LQCLLDALPLPFALALPFAVSRTERPSCSCSCSLGGAFEARFDALDALRSPGLEAGRCRIESRGLAGAGDREGSTNLFSSESCEDWRSREPSSAPRCLRHLRATMRQSAQAQRRSSTAEPASAATPRALLPSARRPAIQSAAMGDSGGGDGLATAVGGSTSIASTFTPKAAEACTASSAFSMAKALVAISAVPVTAATAISSPAMRRERLSALWSAASRGSRVTVTSGAPTPRYAEIAASRLFAFSGVASASHTSSKATR